MERLAKFIVKHRAKIGVFFVVALVISLLLMPKVSVNYDLSEYISDDEPAKHALNTVRDEFGMQGFAQLMLNDVTLIEAKNIKDKITNVDGVDMVLWLDDECDVYQPMAFISEDLLKDYYKDGSALMNILFKEDEYSIRTDEAITEIREIIPENSELIGSAVVNKESRDALKTEVAFIMAILVPIVIVILLITTTSWFSPLLFIAVIGLSILLNMGSNVIFDNVSFITYSIVAALQLAVSMDYSVFMLHQFEEEKKKEKDLETAMVNTICKSSLSILSSAMTTIAGFLALAFMNFGIGKDMGFVFAKGIVLSLICVIFFMPYLILKFDKQIQQTTHRSLLPSFEKFAVWLQKFKFVIVLIIAIIILPAYVGQRNNEFLYGSSSFSGGEGSEIYASEQKIIEKFGRNNMMVLLVPKGDYVSEKQLADDLDNLRVVKKVQTLVNSVPEGMPDAFVPQSAYEKFRTDNYTRYLIYVRTSEESDLAFEVLDQLNETIGTYYSDYELTGATPVTRDIKNAIESDYNVVNFVSLLAVMVILLVTFRSLLLPIILIAVIEIGVFINMSVPFFTGTSLMFLCYMIVSCIQLGATIDYAILMTNNYLIQRESFDKKKAVIEAIKRTTPAILTSGSILVMASFLLKKCSSVHAVSVMGGLIERGTILSIVLVLALLPPLLCWFDTAIKKSIIKKKVED